MRYGMVISPITGQKVLAIQQDKESELSHRDIGKGTLKRRLKGEIGDRYNYVTLENYGQGKLFNIPN